jgi:hypothetical protein
MLVRERISESRSVVLHGLGVRQHRCSVHALAQSFYSGHVACVHFDIHVPALALRWDRESTIRVSEN